MKKSYHFFSIVFLLNCFIVFPQAIDKVLISGTGGQHDTDVKTAFYLGYSSYNNSQFFGEVFLYCDNLLNSYTYANQNNFDLIIRSSTGLSSALQIAPNYPSIELIMPSGSNIFELVYFGDVINSPIIITGAGIDSNVTGYQLEFFSQDPITSNNLSSYSNGYIAGQLTFVANTLGCSLDSARSLARVKSSQDGFFDIYNGFGKIVLEKIMTDALPVELSSFTAELIDKVITLNWRTETEVSNYGFEVERKTNNEWKKIGFILGYGNSSSPKLYSFIDDKPLGSAIFQYRLKQLDHNGQYEYSKIIEIKLIPDEFALYQNYPNPFNPSTTIRYQIPIVTLSEFKESQVQIKIYDILGNEIETLVDDYKATGIYEVEFEAAALSSGIYFYKLNSGSFTQTKKMILTR